MLLPFSFLLGISLVFAACPNDYTLVGGDCYKVFTLYYDFTTAEATCIGDGGHLASIHSLQQSTSLYPIFGQTSPLIGLRCNNETECSWTDGTPYDYENFPSGKPTISYGNCAHLSSVDDLWYSWNCASPVGSFVCQRSASKVCDGDYVEYAGGCVAVVNIPRTLDDAAFDCDLRGGKLASIHSEQDNIFYQQLANASGVYENIYNGLTYDSNSRSYSWMDGSSYNYTNWAAQFPNTYFGTCVQLLMYQEFGYIGQWTNVPCNTKLPYVCWREQGPSPTLAPSVCPTMQYFYDAGTIYSPGFPVAIPADETCEYMIAAPVNTTVSISFPAFSTDNNTLLYLYDGMEFIQPMAILSGSITSNQVFNTTQNLLKMAFVTSTQPSGTGWEATFTKIENVLPTSAVFTTPLPTIASTITLPTTYITHLPYDCPIANLNYTADTFVYSPNWPNTYPSNIDCLYSFYSQNNKRLAIEIDFTDLDATGDFLYLYDGPNTNSNFVDIVTGQSNAMVRTYQSTGPVFTMEFIAKSKNRGRGFSIGLYNL